jgi:hypothetical protein
MATRPPPFEQLPVAQRQGIPHHLIDVLPPTEEFSAGDFYERGRAAAEDILSVSQPHSHNACLFRQLPQCLASLGRARRTKCAREWEGHAPQWRRGCQPAVRQSAGRRSQSCAPPDLRPRNPCPPTLIGPQRGKVPIVVGGTGFYLRWFMYGKPQTQQSTPELRARVEQLVQQVCPREGPKCGRRASRGCACLRCPTQSCRHSVHGRLVQRCVAGGSSL